MTYIGPNQTFILVKDVPARWDPVIMTAIAGAESGWNTTARSPTDDWGLFQINRYYHPDLFRKYIWDDALQNTEMARAVWNSQGYRAWSTYNSGAYRSYLGQVPTSRGQAASGIEARGKQILAGAPGAAHGTDYANKVYYTGRSLQSAFDFMRQWGNAFRKLG